MFETELPSLLATRSGSFLFGAIVVAIVVFTTAAKSPAPRCRRCREFNRPNARFCAHCGRRLK
jgi:hypothetical protein